MKKNLKIVVVGDGSCGKTSLIIAKANGEFHEEYTPTAFDDYAIEALVKDKTKVITVCDTAGEEDFSSLRPLSYPDADVFIVCYSVERPDSLKHIIEKWVPEIKHFCPQTPILVVGNKKDIRDEIRRSSIAARTATNDGGCADCGTAMPVTLKEAEECAREVSNFQLIECSAKTRENVRAVFEQAIRAAIAYRNRRNNRVIQSLLKLRLVF